MISLFTNLTHMHPGRGRLRALLLTSLLASNSVLAQDLPRTMAWSAYNLGTTGNSQAVAIGKMLKDNYGVNLRILPGKNDVSRLLPLVKGRVQFSANGVATFFASEGVFQFASANWGPLPLRLVMTSNGDSNQALAVAGDLGIRSYADLKGKRVPFVRGAPSLNVGTEALMACAGIGWEDVERIEFPGYQAMWDGIINNQVDAAFATTVSGPTRRLEASPRGIYWPPTPHDDAACWAGIRQMGPYFMPHIGTRGAGITVSAPHEGATYPYPLLTGLDSSDSEVVQALVNALHKHFDDYKNADPGGIGWAIDRQIFQWVVPYHRGAVAAYKALGVWSDADQAHNDRLLARQAKLREAWAEMAGSELDGEAFREAWMEKRFQALTSAGFDPIWK